MGQVGIAIGAGVAAGIGGAVAARPLFERLRENVVESRYADDLADKSKLKPGSSWSPFPALTDARGYGDTFPAVTGVFAAGGAAAGAASLFGKGRVGLGIAAAAGAGLLAGAVVGGILGGVQGGRTAHARHGIDIANQARELVHTWDANGSGRLELDDSRGFPEFLRRNPQGRSAEVQWLSIEQALGRADASRDKVVDVAELEALLRSYDANGDGRLQLREAKAFEAAGNERLALVETI